MEGTPFTFTSHTPPWLYGVYNVNKPPHPKKADTYIGPEIYIVMEIELRLLRGHKSCMYVIKDESVLYAKRGAYKVEVKKEV